MTDRRLTISIERLLRIVLSAAVLAVLAAALEAAPAPAAFRAGAATSVITPNLGGAIIGGFVPFPATHIHDELHVRCLVLDDGKTRLAIVVCDLLGISSIVSTEARKAIEEKLKIPAENVLISATHTHSAISALNKSPDQKPDEYQRQVIGRIVDGVQSAANLLRPAQVAWGTAQAPEHVFNRRWHLKPGTMPPNPFGTIDKVKMNPAPGSADLLEPAGPTDPTITILALREPNGKPIAVFSVYSLHYVGGVGPGHVSADYYGMYCRELERLLEAEHQDPPFVAMMANGTSGDVNNIDFVHPRPGKPAYEQMRYVAHDVAGKVAAALKGMTYRDSATLTAKFQTLVLKSRRPSEAQIAWAKNLIASREKKPDQADLPLIYAERTLRLADSPETCPLGLQTLRIGDLLLGTMPCEVFCEIGLEFRKRSPTQPAALVSLAHGYEGYLPTPRHFELGGYETWLGTNRLESEASVKMLDCLGGLVRATREARQEQP